jgi:ribosome recycling factor
MPCQVDYYGVPTPLKSLASVAVPDASTLIVSPFDRSGLRDVEKAILESDIGINPNNDGEKIRLNIPPMTQVGCGTGQQILRSQDGGCRDCSRSNISPFLHPGALSASRPAI